MTRLRLQRNVADTRFEQHLAMLLDLTKYRRCSAVCKEYSIIFYCLTTDTRRAACCQVAAGECPVCLPGGTGWRKSLTISTLPDLFSTMVCDIVVILDEPTAALDPVAEYIIVEVCQLLTRRNWNKMENMLVRNFQIG